MLLLTITKLRPRTVCLIVHLTSSSPSGQANTITAGLCRQRLMQCIAALFSNAVSSPITRFTWHHHKRSCRYVNTKRLIIKAILVVVVRICARSTYKVHYGIAAQRHDKNILPNWAMRIDVCGDSTRRLASCVCVIVVGRQLITLILWIIIYTILIWLQFTFLQSTTVLCIFTLFIAFAV